MATRCHTISTSTGQPCNALPRPSSRGVAWWKTFFCRTATHKPATHADALGKVGQFLQHTGALTDEIVEFLRRTVESHASQVVEILGQWLVRHLPDAIPTEVFDLFRQARETDPSVAEREVVFVSQWLASRVGSMTDEIFSFLSGVYGEAPETVGQVLEAISAWLVAHTPQRLPRNVLALLRWILERNPEMGPYLLSELDLWATQGAGVIDAGLRRFLVQLARSDKWSALHVSLLGANLVGRIISRAWALILGVLFGITGIGFLAANWPKLANRPLAAIPTLVFWLGWSLGLIGYHFWPRLGLWIRSRTIYAELQARWVETQPVRDWIFQNRLWLLIALFPTVAAEVAITVLGLPDRLMIGPWLPWVVWVIWRLSRIPNWGPRLARHWVGLTCLGIIIAWAGLILAWEQAWIGGSELELSVLQSVGLCFWPLVPLTSARVLWKRRSRLTPYIQRAQARLRPVWAGTAGVRRWIRTHWRVIAVAMVTIAAEGVMYRLGWPKWPMLIPPAAWLAWLIWQYRRARELRQRFAAWRQAHRRQIRVTLGLWLFGAQVFLLAWALDYPVFQSKIITMVFGWPIAVWTIALLRWILLRPLGLSRTQAPRPAPRGMDQQRWAQLPRWFLHLRWSLSTPFWLGAIALSAYLAWRLWPWGIGVAIVEFVFDAWVLSNRNPRFAAGGEVTYEAPLHWSAFLKRSFKAMPRLSRRNWRHLRVWLRVLKGVVIRLAPLFYLGLSILVPDWLPSRGSFFYWYGWKWAWCYWIVYTIAGWRAYRHIVTRLQVHECYPHMGLVFDVVALSLDLPRIASTTAGKRSLFGVPMGGYVDPAYVIPGAEPVVLDDAQDPERLKREIDRNKAALHGLLYPAEEEGD